MYGIEKYRADAERAAATAQDKLTRERIAKLNRIEEAYIARGRARIAYNAAQNEDGQGANNLIEQRRLAMRAAEDAFETLLRDAFGPVKWGWE